MKSDNASALIRSVVRGEADRREVAAALRDLGIRSTADLLGVLHDMAASLPKASAESVPVSVLAPRPIDPGERPVHRPVRVPFLLNGVMYDPGDLRRFDGTRLDFVVTSPDHMLAIDDHDLMATWWRLSYLCSLGGLSRYDDLPGVDRYEPGTGVSPADVPSAPPPPKGPVVIPSGGGGGGPGWNGNTLYLFEDAGWRGDTLKLNRGRGYADLTKIGMGLFGDWNDEISSLTIFTPRICVLHDHAGYAGQAIDFRVSVGNLEDFGFNDRTSSVEFW